jgi:Holliday junction resolvase RusA-like endonuclease
MLPVGGCRGASRGAGLPSKRWVIVDDCKTSAAWKYNVRWHVKAWLLEHKPPVSLPVTCAVDLSLKFWFQRPDSHYAMRRGQPRGLRRSAPVFRRKRPDVLKLARAVEDALTGIVWRDDSQIVSERLWKGWFPGPYETPGLTETGVQITVVTYCCETIADCEHEQHEQNIGRAT